MRVGVLRTTIFIEDTPEEITKKIKRAVTDSEGKVYFDPENKPGVSNLLTIYSALKGVTIEEAVEHFAECNYGTLKGEVATAIIDTLQPVQDKYFEYLNNKEYLDSVLAIGRAKADTVADGFDHLAVIPGIGGIGIGEEQHQIDFIIGNPGIDLLVAALLVGKQQGDGQTRVVGNQPAGGGSGEQIVLHQYALVSGAELHHQFLLLVMRQKCNVHRSHSLS